MKKFKVWDTKEKEWVINPRVALIHHEKSWGNDFYLEIDEDWNDEDYDPTRYIFLQSTGLKDKKGNEIYEGDVLITDWDWRNKPVRYFYVKECLPFIELVDKQGFDYDNGDYYQGSNVESHQWKSFEIAGNIYENPELMKK